MSRPVIPIFHAPQTESLSLHAPDASLNLFDRIIRNPAARNRPMRERRCAEMLCAVLLNCPQLRTSIFEEWAALCDWRGMSLSELDYEIDTEQAIGGKRDDLRIEGYDRNDKERTPVLLWTIEIKVQAGIHFSSREAFDEPVEEALEAEADNVTQLENYDRWLRTREVTGNRKAGIVLAIPSLTAKVSKLKFEGKLSEQWHCTRWTDLGDLIESTLEDDAFPESERLVASHLLGFILQHLLDPTEMADQPINIDDLALIRAFAVHGKKCEKRIDNLVAPLMQVFDNSGIPFHDSAPKHQQGLFRSVVRSVVYANLISNKAFKPQPSLSLSAGVRRDDARIWIEASPSSPIYGKVRSVCAERFGALQQQNKDWYMPSAEESNWKVLILSKPLAWLLVEDDQATALAHFVEQGLTELKQTGIIESLQQLGSGTA